MGTPGSTGAAGAVRLASMHRELAWPLATMQVDMNNIFEDGAARGRVEQPTEKEEAHARAS